jgi:hypothetical protein
MKNFLISAAVDVVVILFSYYFFRTILSGPIRHKIYEKFMSSMAKFVIYIFLMASIITGVTAFIMYRTRYISYLNIISAALMSIIVGFVVSTVPTRGIGDKENLEEKRV